MFKYAFLPFDVPISIPKELTKFKCLILIERDVGNDYRNEVSEVLVKAGCLYTLAWGLDCSEWEESVDWAFLEHYDYGEYPKDKFVTTTTHDDETLEETVHFARHCTRHSDVQLDDILVLDFAKRERGDFVKSLYLSM